MHILPEFVCEFDSLLEADDEDEEDGSDIEIDFDIASPSQQEFEHNSGGAPWPEPEITPTHLGNLSASWATYPSTGENSSGDVDIDIFGVDEYECQEFDHDAAAEEEDACDADVSSELDIMEENIDLDADVFSMDVDPQHESESDIDADGEPLTEEPEGNDIPPVIDHIEDMVLLFLKQLAMPGRAGEETDAAMEIGGADDPAVQTQSASEAEDDDRMCGSSEQKGLHGKTGARKLTRADYKIEIPLADRKKRGRDGNDAVRMLRFPRKCKTGSAQSLARLFRVLDLSHEATLNKIPATKRDIYYRDVSLFKSQRVVDELVDDLAATFEVERSDLSIRSSSKGVVCGSGLTINLLSRESISCKDTEGSLIPAGEDIESFSVDKDVAWVLVVEKEAVFQTLCRMKVARHESMPGPGIVITGKGYPDVATRHLVKSLADALPKSIPIVALVDGDPYGLDILSVYKYGSRNMRHEEAKLATRRIKWLGIWASELQSLGIDEEHLIPINEHDEKKALAMLCRRDMPLPGRWRKEMQYMLHSRHKAEIEILSTTKISEGPIMSIERDSCAKLLAFQPEILHDSASKTECGYALTPPPSDQETGLNLGSPNMLLMRYLRMKLADAVSPRAAGQGKCDDMGHL